MARLNLSLSGNASSTTLGRRLYRENLELSVTPVSKGTFTVEGHVGEYGTRGRRNFRQTGVLLPELPDVLHEAVEWLHGTALEI